MESYRRVVEKVLNNLMWTKNLPEKEKMQIAERVVAYTFRPKNKHG